MLRTTASSAPPLPGLPPPLPPKPCSAVAAGTAADAGIVQAVTKRSSMTAAAPPPLPPLPPRPAVIGGAQAEPAVSAEAVPVSSRRSQEANGSSLGQQYSWSFCAAEPSSNQGADAVARVAAALVPAAPPLPPRPSAAAAAAAVTASTSAEPASSCAAVVVTGTDAAAFAREPAVATVGAAATAVAQAKAGTAEASGRAPLREAEDVLDEAELPGAAVCEDSDRQRAVRHGQSVAAESHDDQWTVPTAEARATTDFSPRSVSSMSQGGGSCCADNLFFSRRLDLPPDRVASDSQRLAFNLAALTSESGSLRGRVLRLPGAGLLQSPRYLLYAEREGEKPVFLACASRAATRHGSVKPYYAISSSEREELFSRRSPHILGRLKGSLLSTSYSLYGHSLCRAADTVGGPLLGAERPEEVLLEVNFRKPTDAPRTMEVTLPPRPPGGGRRELREAWSAETQVTPASGGGGSATHRSSSGSEVLAPIRLVSPAPVYDEESNVYSMNFHGRVCRASAKNFQLVTGDRGFRPLIGAQLCMQFGRADDDDTFHLDVGSPLSPLQAFALALTVFDHRPAEALRMYY